MSYENQLVMEINSRLDALAETGQAWRAQWVTHAICNDHKEGLVDGDHAAFWQHCGYAKTRDLVTRCINKRAGDKEEGADRQHVLDGFERLQTYYVVKRDGDEIGVPTDDMTDAELTEKAAVYRTIASGCWLHAQELDRFRETRASERSLSLFTASPAHA